MHCLKVFHAEWCPKCESMMDWISAFEPQYPEFGFCYIDVASEKKEDKEAIEKARIDELPIVILYDDNGEEVFRLCGAFTKKSLHKRLDSLQEAK